MSFGIAAKNVREDASKYSTSWREAVGEDLCVGSGSFGKFLPTILENIEFVFFMAGRIKKVAGKMKFQLKIHFFFFFFNSIQFNSIQFSHFFHAP